jgi:hypothetical protein
MIHVFKKFIIHIKLIPFSIYYLNLYTFFYEEAINKFENSYAHIISSVTNLYIYIYMYVCMYVCIYRQIK